MSQSQTSGLRCGGIKDVQKYLVAHYDELSELYRQVDLHEEFLARDLQGHLPDVLDAFASRGIVQCVGTQPLPEDDDKRINRYRLVARHREWVTGYEPHTPALPCGHHGIRNLGAEITCTNDWCEESYPTATVRAFLDRQ